MTTQATAKPKKTRNTFTMPQRLTGDGEVSVVGSTAPDYIHLQLTATDGEETMLIVSEYNATRLLRMLAEHLKVALPAGVVEKIRKAEPREPRKS